MTKNQKKLLGLLLILGALFLLSGCMVPTEVVNGKDVPIPINPDTTFTQMFQNEDWFQAIFVFPLAKVINITAPIVGVAAAIAIVTVGVNLLTLMLTIKSTVGQQKMTMIQPETNRITKKYAGKKDEASRMKQGQEIQALYKKHGINPLSTILGSFVQFPVIFAIYHAVQRASEVSTGSFLGLSLSQSPLQGIQNGQYLYIVLFLVMLIAQVGAMKFPNFLTNYKAKKEAALHHQKFVKVAQPGGNMMVYVMVGMMVIAVNWPAAMTIYWIISSTVTILKTLLINFVFMKDKAV